ncbi:GH25 family lysozyme [Nocardioides sp. TF02-7]|uniref:glycoside hydrolase family 25 protein n=1 Tax=Nocardioides sp. TF02-7 TaxID=2917724 RepID=UPI001F05AB94|nr:GH25 family lysozyme [Nocardioides sp. TF02-7]UMG94267.1 hypothetical protein MF408_09755 [Nocardioides sp. TF02-7]
MRPLLPVLLLVLALTGCASDDEPPSQSGPSASDGSPSAATSSTARPSSDPPEPTRTPRPRRVRGIDVSHHQGEIDWRAVAGDGVRFAYLKATEGTTFTDPRYAANRAEALDAGLRVGGYHYYSLCTAGADQAAHFADVLGDVAGRRHLPPVVDLELAGSCSTPPPREELLEEVRAFVDVVERRTGRRVVVYAFPRLRGDVRVLPGDRPAAVGAAARRPAPRPRVVDLAAQPDRHRRRHRRPGRPRRHARGIAGVRGRF